VHLQRLGSCLEALTTRSWNDLCGSGLKSGGSAVTRLHLASPKYSIRYAYSSACDGRASAAYASTSARVLVATDRSMYNFGSKLLPPLAALGSKARRRRGVEESGLRRRIGGGPHLSPSISHRKESTLWYVGPQIIVERWCDRLRQKNSRQLYRDRDNKIIFRAFPISIIYSFLVNDHFINLSLSTSTFGGHPLPLPSLPPSEQLPWW
jgi:hypothetical protein